MPWISSNDTKNVSLPENGQAKQSNELKSQMMRHTASWHKRTFCELHLRVTWRPSRPIHQYVHTEFDPRMVEWSGRLFSHATWCPCANGLPPWPGLCASSSFSWEIYALFFSFSSQMCPEHEQGQGGVHRCLPRSRLSHPSCELHHLHSRDEDDYQTTARDVEANHWRQQARLQGKSTLRPNSILNLPTD